MHCDKIKPTHRDHPPTSSLYVLPDSIRCLRRAAPVKVSFANGTVGSAFRYRSCALVTETLFTRMLHGHVCGQRTRGRRRSDEHRSNEKSVRYRHRHRHRHNSINSVNSVNNTFVLSASTRRAMTEGGMISSHQRT